MSATPLTDAVVGQLIKLSCESQETLAVCKEQGDDEGRVEHRGQRDAYNLAIELVKGPLSNLELRCQELEKELEPLRQLKADADKEMAELADRAAHGFIANAKRELDVLMNAYIGHLGGLPNIIQDRDTLRAQNERFREALETYGHHKPSCSDFLNCNCGYRQALSTTTTERK